MHFYPLNELTSNVMLYVSEWLYINMLTMMHHLLLSKLQLELQIFCAGEAVSSDSSRVKAYCCKGADWFSKETIRPSQNTWVYKMCSQHLIYPLGKWWFALTAILPNYLEVNLHNPTMIKQGGIGMTCQWISLLADTPPLHHWAHLCGEQQFVPWNISAFVVSL